MGKVNSGFFPKLSQNHVFSTLFQNLFFSFLFSSPHLLLRILSDHLSLNSVSPPSSPPHLPSFFSIVLFFLSSLFFFFFPPSRVLSTMPPTLVILFFHPPPTLPATIIPTLFSHFSSLLFLPLKLLFPFFSLQCTITYHNSRGRTTVVAAATWAAASIFSTMGALVHSETNRDKNFHTLSIVFVNCIQFNYCWNNLSHLNS